MGGVIFIALNIADAYLTRVGIAMGSSELLSWSAPFSSNMVAKGLIAAAIVIGLYWFGREKSLWWMNLIVFGAALWNFFNCAYGHLIGGLPWG